MNNVISEGTADDFYLNEMQRTKFRPLKQILIAELHWINRNFMPRTTPSARNHEKLPFNLKAFVRMAMATEKEAGLSVFEKWIAKNALTFPFGRMTRLLVKGGSWQQTIT
jgi:hypothetical protein